MIGQRSNAASLLPAAVLLLLTAIASSVVAGASDAPRKGGALRIGMIGEPPTLDAHPTTAVITRDRRERL